MWIRYNKDMVFCAGYDEKTCSKIVEYDGTRQPRVYLHREGVEKVTMESTSAYRIPIWNILSELGFSPALVNLVRIKQMPGHKSDVKDAQRIDCLLHGWFDNCVYIPTNTMSNSETKSFMNIVPALPKQKTAPAELSKLVYNSTADKSLANCLIF